jgi:hypothetical protein
MIGLSDSPALRDVPLLGLRLFGGILPLPRIPLQSGIQRAEQKTEPYGGIALSDINHIGVALY